MNSRKSVLIRKNKDFIFVSHYLIGRISISDPTQDFNFLPCDIEDLELGNYISRKLKNSRIINTEEFNKLFYSNEIKDFTERLEMKLKKKFNYRNKKLIYKDMDFVSIDIEGCKLTITPHHQDSLGGFTSVNRQDGKAIEFEYPANLSDEELGAAVMEALKYCTSIYKRK
ncbi:CdiI family contact-dependent growth inhibition immunity protein [Mannheimia pernigra]|uniref:CdiI family contact-dependent growth inhibition immunity protein n=1 Tax=Mannheimia pernigra TaxID=111844 RepID=A0ABD7A846_9PAST|nr:contact-dependent growth inhibition system immunity protein [Mannheimia pernigra]QLB42326.1 CdiI family contact-dependent growth inhibition immunity protein [Mannheimia pernigra]